MCRLSIIIPAIRNDRWENVLNSIAKSCTKYSYEVIFIGPNKYNDTDNVRYIQDLASPNICQHKALQRAKGDILHIFSDDCLFAEGSIDICLDRMDCDAIIPNYDEGGNAAVGNFSLNYCYAKTITPDSFVIFNTAFMKRERYFELGGFDCRFETLCVAQADLAARWQFSNFSVKIENIVLSRCGHMPGTTGDHGPMHWAQVLNDIPLYLDKYSAIPQLVVDPDNWKNQPRIWSRRF